MLTLSFAIQPPQNKIVSPLKQKPFSSIASGLIAHSKRNESKLKGTKNPFGFSCQVPKVVACGLTDAYGEESVNHVEKEEQLPEGLEAELMPKHVAVIMDGNRRWALQRDLPASLGHQAGRKTLEKLGRVCGKLGIKVLTVYAFSTENWSRPKVSSFFPLLRLFILPISSYFHSY